MTPKQVNTLQRNIDTLDNQSLGYLEQHLIIHQPTKSLYLLVDKLFEYAYNADGEAMVIGKIDTFNCKKDTCKLYHPMNLLYHGKLDNEHESDSYYAYFFTLDRLCYERLKKGL